MIQTDSHVLLVEKENRLGSVVSSRNSEVIHAGIYYSPGSLKARLCVDGKIKLYEYAQKFNIGHNRIGKWIIASEKAQLQKLEAILENAKGNGVEDIYMQSANYFSMQCSELRVEAGLVSETTGIIDVHGLMQSFALEFENAGGTISKGTRFISANHDGRLFHIQAESHQERTELTCEHLINAAGLNAVDVINNINGYSCEEKPAMIYAKGSYFSYSGETPFKHLVYPVPEDGGLGVHLTFDLAGNARFGPDVQWLKSPADLTVDENRKDAFAAAIHDYWPACSAEKLQPAYSGIRPKVSLQNGQVYPDFLIQDRSSHGMGGLINLLGIESPGITASLAIADYVAALLA